MFINDTPRAHIRVFDVRSDGTLADRGMFFDAVGTGSLEDGIPDGVKCDERGNVWVTGPGGVWVISPDGVHLGVIEVPENVGNLTWGGDDWRTLFIPSSTTSG
jgi:gluconolactonase